MEKQLRKSEKTNHPHTLSAVDMCCGKKSESKTNGRSRTQINHREGHDETLEFEQSHTAASIAHVVSCHLALRQA